METECSVLDKLLFREKEKNFLISYFGPRTCLPPQNLFIYGHTATGKTFLVLEILKTMNLPHAWVNCHESCTPQLIFSCIVDQLNPDEQDLRCNNLCEFVYFSKSKLSDRDETVYLIFDNAEVLRNKNPIILASLLRLQEFTKLNISSVFISELPWINFKSQMIAVTPVSLHFPNYTKEQLCKILCVNAPTNYPRHIFEGYIGVILKTFYTVTRNLKELQHLAEINFEKYCEPLKNEPEEELSALRLWKNIEPTLKQAMNAVYLREISGSKWATLQNDSKTISSYKSQVTRELPFYSKFLLLAAYFASYNVPKNDFKHFVKNQGKQKKKRVSRKTAKNRHLLGPKAFTLDRMLSIFFSIVGEHVLPSALIFSQVSSLVSMRLMTRMSADEQLDCPKYKCLADLELVQKIGRTVKIDVMGYLDDFL